MGDVLTVVGFPDCRPGQSAGIAGGPGKRNPGVPVSGYGHDVLHGRDVELARLVALIEDARGGTAGSVVVHGEPGVGKSALLAEVLSSVSDVRVLRTQGLESESPLAFAALHRLLRPVLDLVGRLPEPQARALGVAFGQEVGTVEPFLVAVATLSILTEAAEELPVVCIVDDAHWLDSASTDALLFATRRLEADPVAMVFAARDTDDRTFAPDGVPALRLEGLDAASVRALLAENAPVVVAAEVTDRLLAETGGNPLALVELPTGLSDAQLAGSVPLPPQLMLTAGVERVFLDRSRRLSAAAQTLMLVAVADDTGQLATVERAAATLGLSPDALAEAERSGLLVISGDTVTVRHPLVRSAVYQAATANERREVHRGLADALDSLEDSDRATWHRAAAADGPDESLVAALAQVGARAERRGGYRAAADAHERAADLSVDPLAKAGLQLAAARNAWASGQTARSSRLLSAARERADEPAPARGHRPAPRPHRGECRLRGRRAPDLHPGRWAGRGARTRARARDGGGRRGRAQPRHRQRSTAPCRRHRCRRLAARHPTHPMPQAPPGQHPARHRRRPRLRIRRAPRRARRQPSGRPTRSPTSTCSGTSRTLPCTWATTTRTATSTP